MPGYGAIAALGAPEVRPRIVELLYLALLDLQSGIVDGSAIDAWRCSRLEASHRKTSLLELLGEVSGGSIASSPPGNPGLCTDMDTAVQESARGNYHALCAEAPSFHGLNAEYAPFVRREKEPADSALHGLKSWLFLQKRSDRAAVQSTIALRTRSPDSGSFAAVQHPKLDHREISSSPHDSSQRVDFAHDRSFGNTANSWIARHLTDRLQRTRDQSDSSAKARRRDRRLCSRVAGAYDYNVKLCFEARQLRHTLKIKRALVLVGFLSKLIHASRAFSRPCRSSHSSKRIRTRRIDSPGD
jgi:hypothetical protein